MKETNKQILVQEAGTTTVTSYNNLEELFISFSKENIFFVETKNGILKTEDGREFILNDEIKLEVKEEIVSDLEKIATERRNKLRQAIIMLDEQGIDTKDTKETLGKTFKFLSQK